MSLLTFVKNAGEKLLVTDTSGDPEADQASADSIKNYIGTNGIDTSGLIVAYDSFSSTVTVSGEAPDQATLEKIVLCCGNVRGVSGVNDNLTVAAAADESQFYDVVSGDNLSKISKQYYGDPNNYPQIFEANKPMLQSVDKIYPGEKLRIPPLA